MQSQHYSESGDSSSPAGDRSAVERIESSLKDRRAEMTRMMAEMRDLYHSGRSQAQVEIEGLRNEKLQIQQHLEQRAQELAALAEKSRAAEAQAEEKEQHYRNVLAEAEAALADQGDEIARLVAEFKQAIMERPDTAVYPRSQADVTTLSPQAMREIVRSNQEDVPTLTPQVTRELIESTKKINQLEEEVNALRAELGQRDQLIQEFHAQQYAARLTASTHPAEIEHLRGELTRLQEDHQAAHKKLATMAPATELESLRNELARSQEELSEANRKSTTMATMVPAAEADKLRGELVRAREQVLEANRKAALAQNAAPSAEVDKLRTELTRVREELLQANRHAATPAAELEKVRNELLRTREELAESNRKVAAAPLMAPAGETEKLRSDLARMREQLQEANRKVAAALTMVPAAEAEKLRSELVRVREQFQEAKNKLAAAPSAAMAAPALAAGEIENLQKEQAKLQLQLAEKEKALRNSVPTSDVEKLIAELGRARSEIAKLQENPLAAPNALELDQLRAELTILQEELHEKDRKLEELHASGGGPVLTDNAKIAQYEAELIRYHRQLESDRQTLNASIEQLEKRNADLTQAAQKAQQDLAGERAQLNQLRDELHIDLAFEDLAFLARKHLAPIQPAKKK